MNRWATAVVGAVLLGLVGALVWKSGGPSKPAAPPAASAEHRSESSPSDSGVPSAHSDPLAMLKFDVDGGFGNLRQATEPKGDDPGAGLPSGSPKTVRFGVILIQYRGAELAPPGTRSKQEALALARTVAEAAGTDFKAQVHQGDPGSMEDAGRIQRGVLEPAVEYALFMLPRGSVSEPIDTPRGFWIVRRIE
jgi:hypothetical protein